MGWRDFIAGLRAASAAQRAAKEPQVKRADKPAANPGPDTSLDLNAEDVLEPDVREAEVPEAHALETVVPEADGRETDIAVADVPTSPMERLDTAPPLSEAVRPASAAERLSREGARARSASPSLREIVSRGPASHGLTLSAGMYEIFEETSVSEFLNGVPPKVDFLSLLGFGITKYQELQHLCAAYSEGRAAEPMYTGEDSPSEPPPVFDGSEQVPPAAMPPASVDASENASPPRAVAPTVVPTSAQDRSFTLAELVSASGSAALRASMSDVPLGAQPVAAFRNDVRDRRAFTSIPGFSHSAYDEMVSLVDKHRLGADEVHDRSAELAPAPSGDRADPMPQTTLAALIDDSAVSTRLGNVAQRSAVFAKHTVADLIAGRLTEAELLRIPNFGRTTLLELRGLVKSFAQAAADGRLPSVTHQSPPEVEPIQEAPRSLEGLTVADLLDHADLPIRIANRAAVVPELRDYPLSALATDRAGAMRTLSAIGGVGRKSVSELADLVARIAHEGGLQDAPVGEDVRVAADTARADEPAPPDDPMEGVITAIAALSERHQSVLDWRYGLRGDAPLTLQEIADRVHVTRERVRQVERKALLTLGRRPWRTMFERLLADRGLEAWRLFAQGEGLVPAAELGPRSRSIAPHLLLAIDVVHRDVRAWLDAFATPVPGGWLPPGGSAGELRDHADQLRAVLESWALPRPFSDICCAAGVEPASAEAAMSLIPGFRVHDGYVHAGFLGSKARRAARMHALALSSGEPVFDVWRLAELDAKAEHDDDPSPRMVSLQLEENPHLFHRLFDQVWAVLPPPRTWRGAPEAMPPVSDAVLNVGFEAGSLSGWLHDVLEREGPQRHVDLRERAIKAVPGISRASIGPILLSHPVFVRAAPGIYALRSERYVSVSSSLLSTGQARTYARAVRSGVARNQFPAWTASFEWRLCEWARSSSDDDVFRSLLTVVSPAEWPAPEAVRAEWLGTQERHARWMLASDLDAPLGSDPPSPSVFLAGLIHLALLGSIGWISAARVTQSRLGSQGPADLLALLVAAGAADCPEHWQDAHAATELTIPLLEQLADAASRGGELSWNSPVPAQILTNAAANAHLVRWSDPAEVKALLSHLQNGAQPSPEPTGPALAEVDELFASEEWENLFSG